MLCFKTVCIKALWSCFNCKKEVASIEVIPSRSQDYLAGTDIYKRASFCSPPAFLQQSLKALAPPDEHREVTKRQPISVQTIVGGGKIQHIIVVLGAPTPAGSTIAASLQNRIEKAATLSKTYPEARIICSGGAVATSKVKNPAVEAQVMWEGLQKLGVNKKHIIAEPLAQTTKGNAEETLKLLAQLPLQDSCRLILVVEPWQAVRAMRAFLQAKDKYDFSRHCTITLAPVERLAVAQSSVANPAAEMPREWRYAGWKPTMDTVCSADSRENFERQLSEKLKLLWGY
ncbi:MAG: YdcF family protein [Cytophagaceae bacterium]|nr:MAG: YdcF family protein [Cytophagaceae bacterium]